MAGQGNIDAPLLVRSNVHGYAKKNTWARVYLILLLVLTISVLGFVAGSWTSWVVNHTEHQYTDGKLQDSGSAVVDSETGIVAADDGRCSEIGASMLRKGGHAVDAAVATALCLGVVYPTSSGIGGGAFMVVRSASTSQALAFDMRETAPSAASENMYKNNPEAKSSGPLSIGVPGELAGLHEAWKKYGRLPWSTLIQPAIQLAKNGFEISPYLGKHLIEREKKIMADLGLRQMFAPNSRLLQAGEICYNVELGKSLEAVADHGPQAFYNGTVGENLVEDIRQAGGILTMEDLRNYRVKVTDAMAVDVMGYKMLGMPPPSSGTLGLSLILNILNNYGSSDALEGSLGLHRLTEALKHMLAIRMNLGDPDFVDVTKYISDMTSQSFAKNIWQKIYDNTTFPPEYYMSRWSQLQDHGTSHFCIIDAERNAVSMTTTVNGMFGAGIISPSTGVLLNNEMDDFSTPTEIHADKLPPAPSNFIQPGKRPLSSMTPLIILKDDQVAGVIGGSGGILIIQEVAQVFLNHFIMGKEPLMAVQSPRVYHKLMPNVAYYENLTLTDGEHIELPEATRVFLEERGHKLKPITFGAICQLIVQTFNKSGSIGSHRNLHFGTLTAVSDPRKGGKPAAE